MKIGIIGLGLIGGSLLKALVGKGHDVVAVTRNQNTLEKIRDIVVDCSSDYNILSDCNIVFVCTPIHKIIESLDKLENIVSKNCTVTDVASVKTFVTKKERPYKFIPSHPMAGTENSGYDASFAELFEGAKWVLTPYYCYETEELINLIKETGAVPILANAEEHDEAVAMISHFPMYLSQCLFDLANKNKLAMQLASSGFRDTTRLAMTDLNLANDMLEYNEVNISKVLEKFCDELKSLKTDYAKKLVDIRKNRRLMYSADGKNVVPLED